MTRGDVRSGQVADALLDEVTDGVSGTMNRWTSVPGAVALVCALAGRLTANVVVLNDDGAWNWLQTNARSWPAIT
jgi:hypothetical protein